MLCSSAPTLVAAHSCYFLLSEAAPGPGKEKTVAPLVDSPLGEAYDHSHRDLLSGEHRDGRPESSRS